MPKSKPPPKTPSERAAKHAANQREKDEAGFKKYNRDKMRKSREKAKQTSFSERMLSKVLRGQRQSEKQSAATQQLIMKQQTKVATRALKNSENESKRAATTRKQVMVAIGVTKDDHGNADHGDVDHGDEDHGDEDHGDEDGEIKEQEADGIDESLAVMEEESVMVPAPTRTRIKFGPNKDWTSGTSINLPLTLDSRTIFVDMSNSNDLTSTGARLVQEAVETNVPVTKKDGLGGVLKQLDETALSKKLLDCLWRVQGKRSFLQHVKKRIYGLDKRALTNYEEDLIDSLGQLCPNWRLVHLNQEAQGFQAWVRHLRAENDHLKRENEYLKRQLYNKRSQDDGHDLGGPAKRARQSYEVHED